MRHRPVFAAPAEPAPLASINITPLIDVLLVLLVMLILTIPMVTHEVPIDLPQPGPATAAARVTHLLVLDRDGVTRLDGVAMDATTLGARLAALRDDPAAELTMRTDPAARYVCFDETLAVVKRAGITRLGFVGNEAMAD